MKSITLKRFIVVTAIFLVCSNPLGRADAFYPKEHQEIARLSL